MGEKNFLENIFLKKWQPYFWIAFLIFILYFPSLFFDFNYLDDNVLILDNYHLLKKPFFFFQAFKEEVFHSPRHSAYYYRPLQTIALMLGALLSGKKPSSFAYHLMNISFHIFACWLFFFFLLKFNPTKDVAFCFSLIFSLHPVLVQAVAWIPGSVDILLTIFIFLFFIFLMKFLRKQKWYYYFFQLFFLILALLTKETALATPLMGFLYLLLITKEKIFSFRTVILGSGWITILIFWFFLRRIVIGKAIGFSLEVILKDLISNSPAILQFLGKTIFPFNLSVLPIIKDTTIVYGIIVLFLLILFIFLSKRRRTNFLFFGISWFLFFLLPTIFRPNPSLVADFLEHRLYLPFFGLFLILAEIDWLKKINFSKKTFFLVFLPILTLFFCIALLHSENFKNKNSFWENAAKTSPHHPLAHRNLGAMYYLDGKLEDAQKEFEKSLEINPLEPMAHNNLGLIYMNKGNLQMAQDEFEKEIKINPYWETPYFNFGLLKYKQGKLKEAEDLWKKTIQLNPNYLDAYYYLAKLYLEEKEYKMALLVLEKILKIQPNNKEIFSLILEIKKQENIQ